MNQSSSAKTFRHRVNSKPTPILDSPTKVCYPWVENRFSGEEKPKLVRALVPREKRTAMSIRMNRRLVCCLTCLLAILALSLSGALRANAQASCTGVSPDTQGAVTLNPQWCEEFNAAAAGQPRRPMPISRRHRRRDLRRRSLAHELAIVR